MISPQYLLWLVALAAVCLLFAGSGMTRPAVLVVAASAVTVLEFPVFFGDVVGSTPLGVGLMLVRNGLLVAACLLAGRALWRRTVPGAAGATPDGAQPSFSRRYARQAVVNSARVVPSTSRKAACPPRVPAAR